MSEAELIAELAHWKAMSHILLAIVVGGIVYLHDMGLFDDGDS